MYALERPHLAHVAPLGEGTPVALLVTLAAAWVAAHVCGALGWLPRRAIDIVGLAVAHGALLGIAVAWTTKPRAQAWLPTALLVVAGALAALGPPGLLGHALLPLWLVWLARDGRVGWLRPAPSPLILSGALVGAVLGAHMLVGATLTLGHRIGSLEVAALLPWLAYDVGANVPAGEAFFRCALFARVHRRWPLGMATAISTSVYVARYLVDPLLPKTLELMAGAAFYLSLLGIANCWFFARTGSAWPGLAASLLFFAAYRLLAPA